MTVWKTCHYTSDHGGQLTANSKSLVQRQWRTDDQVSWVGNAVGNEIVGLQVVLDCLYTFRLLSVLSHCYACSVSVVILLCTGAVQGKKYSCSLSGNSTVLCAVGNPLTKDDDVQFAIRLDPSKVVATFEKLHLVVTVNTWVQLVIHLLCFAFLFYSFVFVLYQSVNQFNSISRLAARGPNSKWNASEIVHKNNKNQNKRHT